MGGVWGVGLALMWQLLSSMAMVSGAMGGVWAVGLALMWQQLLVSPVPKYLER